MFGKFSFPKFPRKIVYPPNCRKDIQPCLSVVISVSALSAIVSEDITHEVEDSQQYNDSPISRPGFDDALQTAKYKQQASPHQVCVGSRLQWSFWQILTSIVRLAPLTESNIESEIFG